MVSEWSKTKNDNYNLLLLSCNTKINALEPLLPDGPFLLNKDLKFQRYSILPSSG